MYGLPENLSKRSPQQLAADLSNARRLGAHVTGVLFSQDDLREFIRVAETAIANVDRLQLEVERLKDEIAVRDVALSMACENSSSQNLPSVYLAAAAKHIEIEKTDD